LNTLFDLAQLITKVEHPYIKDSLTNLGIVTDIDLEDNIVQLEFVWPFPNIPIRQELINSIEMVVKELGFSLSFTERIMTPQEKNEFLVLEKAGWKGKPKAKA